jgi:hypothetical protein
MHAYCMPFRHAMAAVVLMSQPNQHCCNRHYTLCCCGLQARERTRLVALAKRSRAVEERRRQAGVALSKDEAVTKIQVLTAAAARCRASGHHMQFRCSYPLYIS